MNFLKKIARLLLPVELRWRIKKLISADHSGEREYIFHDSIPELGTTARGHYIIYDLISSTISKGTVLDMGCGSGMGSFLLSKNCDRVIAVDYSKAAIEFARKNNSSRNIEFISSDVKDFGYPDLFDCIVMVEFLEHNKDPKAIIQQMYSMLKPGGKMIITVPRRPEGTPIKQGWHLFEFTDTRFKDVFKDYKYEVKGFKNLAKVSDEHYKDVNNIFVDLDEAGNFFVELVKK